MTGIDISHNAVSLARKHAKERGVRCDFLAVDWKKLPGIDKKFGFILDWRFLHEITDEGERKEYVHIVRSLLEDNGAYLSVAFSGEFKEWGKGKLRKSPVGIVLCMPSNIQLEKLFSEKFIVQEKKMIKLPEKGMKGGVTGYFFLMRKK